MNLILTGKDRRKKQINQKRKFDLRNLSKGIKVISLKI